MLMGKKSIKGVGETIDAIMFVGWTEDVAEVHDRIGMSDLPIQIS